MNLTLKILAEASVDIKQIANWYKEISSLLALRFVSHLYDGFSKITSNPDAWFNLTPRVKRYRLNNFPYLILYLRQKDEIIVFAVIHERRNPKEWKRRLRK